jgi:hypothetical protein
MPVEIQKFLASETSKKIQLAEIPKDIHESTVLVTFLENKTRTWSNIILQHQGFTDSINFES